MMEKNYDTAVLLAVKVMMPKNSLGRSLVTNVRVYKNAEHNQAAQKPEMWNY